MKGANRRGKMNYLSLIIIHFIFPELICELYDDREEKVQLIKF